MKRKKNRENNVFFYVLFLAFGMTVLYAFSVLPRTTGFATSEPPEACKSYFGDEYCDDSPEDCGVFYDARGVKSLDACNECQTGGFDC